METTYDNKTNFEYLQKVQGLSKLNVLNTISEGILITMDFQNGGSTSTTLNFLSICSGNLVNLGTLVENNTELQNISLDTLYPNVEFSSNRPWLDLDSTDDCAGMFEEFLFEMKEEQPDDNFDGDWTEQSTEEFVSNLFMYGTYNYSTNIKHTRCLAMENEVLQAIQEPLVRAKEAWAIIWLNLTTAETIQDALVSVERLAGYYRDVINNKLLRQTYYNKMEENCRWLEEFSGQNMIPYEQLEIGKEIRKQVRKILDVMQRDYLEIYESFITAVHPNIENLDRYLSKNITKIELSKILGQISFVQSTEILYGENADILSSIKEYTTEMTLAKENLLAIYNTLISLKLPIVNTHNVYELELVKQSGSLDDFRLQEIVDSLKSDVSHLTELVSECYDRLIKSVEEMTTALVKPIEDVLEQLQELRRDLRIYQASTEMDTDFFM